jgi:hypothetical protein
MAIDVMMKLSQSTNEIRNNASQKVGLVIFIFYFILLSFEKEPASWKRIQ